MAVKKTEAGRKPAAKKKSTGRGKPTVTNKSTSTSGAATKKVDKTELEKALSDCWDAIKAQLALRNLKLSPEANSFWRDRYTARFRMAMELRGKHWDKAGGKDEVLRHVVILLKAAEDAVNKSGRARVILREHAEAASLTDCKPTRGKPRPRDGWCTS